MRIGILQTGFSPKPLANEFGEYPQMFEQLLTGNDFEFETFVVAKDHFPKNIHACDGWLITGSSHSAYNKVAFIAKLESFIQDAYSANIPIVGICFGHQIMAQALGGKVEKHDAGLNIGQSTYQYENESIDLLAIHQDQVTKIPKDAEVILSSDFCKIAGIAYNGPAISFQPHPEFSPDFMRALINFKSDRGLSIEQATHKQAGVKTKNGSDKLAAIVSKFLKTNISTGI